MCLYPSIRSLKFQRFGVTQEFSTAVQCLQINNEEQTRVSQELYPLCFSSHCPLLLTEKKKRSYNGSEAAETSGLGCDCGDSREDGAAEAADVLSMFGPQIYALPPWGGGCFLCSPDPNTSLPDAGNRSANRILENPHRSAATLDLLAPVAPMANVPQQLLAALHFFHFSSLSPSFFFLFLNSHWLTPALLLRGLTITEITARGAVLLHQASLAVTIAPASPGRTDK